MKITGADIFVCPIDGRSPVILELHTAEGVAGLGEAALAYGSSATAAAALIGEVVERFVVGRDAMAAQAIWATLYDHSFWARGGGPVIYAAISAVDQCLWDIKARALGVPVYQLLGGPVRREVRVYANGWSFAADTPAAIARAAEATVAAGYDALKMYPLGKPMPDDPHGRFVHVERREYDRDVRDRAVAMVAAVREAVGDRVDLMCDMSAELGAKAITELGLALQDFDLMFLEEPVEPTDTPALKSVRDDLRCAVAVGERLYSRYGFRPVMEARAADVLQPDIGNTGGLSETWKIAAMSEAFSMRVAPHVCAGPVATAVALQLDAALPNFLVQEIYPFRVPEHFALVDDPVEERIVEGRVAIDDRPGYGVALDRARVAPFHARRVVA